MKKDSYIIWFTTAVSEYYSLHLQLLKDKDGYYGSYSFTAKGWTRIYTHTSGGTCRYSTINECLSRLFFQVGFFLFRKSSKKQLITSWFDESKVLPLALELKQYQDYVNENQQLDLTLITF